MINSEFELWPSLRHFIAGYASGVCLLLAGHPFDTIKVRLQAEGPTGRFHGPLHCLKQTIKYEGVLGLYKGMSAPLISTGFLQCFLFGVQYQIVDVMVNLEKAKKRSSEQIEANWKHQMQAAILSGALQSFLGCPIEGVKGRLQVQYRNLKNVSSSKDPSPVYYYRGPMDCFMKVYQKLGVRHGLYRGWSADVLVRMSLCNLFGSYFWIRNELMNYYYGAEATRGVVSPKLPLSASILAGGLSGICFWVSCYPFDVIKNRLQTAPDVSPPLYRNFRHVVQVMYRKDGFRAFWAGFVPCLLRAFPANAASFFGLELCYRFLPE